MVTPRTSRQRTAARIPLDYFREPDHLRRARNGLALGALLVAVAWCAAGLFRGPSGQVAYMRGPVAAVHATWEQDCNACHVPFRPISREAWAGSLLHDSHEPDAKCETCHAGPPHHASARTEDTPTCAGCHREHRGRDASLVRLPDAACTSCHRALPNHMYSQDALRYAEKVTRFDTDHPRFHVGPNPSRLWFSHARHLAPGMKLPGGGPVLTVGHLPAADRDRYRLPGQGDSAAVQLSCASCHRLDGKDFNLRPGQLDGVPVAAVLPPRSAGAYMLPITYENQCKACHPLTVLMPASGKAGPRETRVPHRLQPADLHEYLRREAVGQYVRGAPALLEQPLPRLDRPDRAASTTASAAIDELVRQAETTLYLTEQTCGRCHNFDTHGRGPPANAVRRGKAPAMTVEPTHVRNVWYKHATFDHTAHRAVRCDDCHDAAQSQKTEPGQTLLPDIDNCLKCHAPRTTVGGVARGGARFECTECHRYHNGDQPLQGVGAAVRGVAPSERLGLDDFRSVGVVLSGRSKATTAARHFSLQRRRGSRNLRC